MLQNLPVLPLKDIVVFPQIVVPLAVGRSRSMAAVKAALEDGKPFVAVAQKDPNIAEPSFADLHEVGTVVTLNRVEKRDEGSQVIVQGDQRVRLIADIINEDFLRASVETQPLLTLQDDPDQTEIDAFVRVNRELAQSIARLFDPENGDQIYQQLVGHLTDPIEQMYRIASLANLTLTHQQAILDCDTPLTLMQQINSVLSHELRVTELRREIAEKARDDIEQQQRQHVLRQQKHAIEQALGEDREDEDLTEIKAQLAQAQLPEPVSKDIERELRRFSRLSTNAPDYQMARSYLEWVAELPWHACTVDNLDLNHAKTVLDEDHYGLTEVKTRILDALAVMQLNPASKAPIICLVGPPGVGKTSLGQSIARAMNRKFERFSLGGLHDEAELRGHRRTYIGAMPGRVLQSMRRAEVTNPVIMLDELDKLGQDFRGDPSAALMEILDPAQNHSFRDNYLNQPYDLSQVMFIATANTIDGIARPLLDRMEIIWVSGYSDLEKQAICTTYLVPRQQTAAGLTIAQVNINEAAIKQIIRNYTREAGVRELDRMIAKISRKRARQVVEGDRNDRVIAPSDLEAFLGPEKFNREAHRDTQQQGVAAGLAWTESGGDVLYVEASLMPKEENIILTGQLGQVMQESAKTARSYIWRICSQLGIDPQDIEAHGVHIHVPAGAVPKDGPSAGVTIATAIASAYSQHPVDSRVAMTGELTLTGLVLPVGGIKEKVLAAHRAGFTHLVIPRDNQTDLTQLPDSVSEDLTFTFANELADVFSVALPGLLKPQP